MDTKSILPVALAVALAGCGSMIIETNPNTFNIKPEAAAQLRAPQTVTLQNAYENQAEFPIGGSSQLTWRSDFQQLTETAIAMLGRALEKQGIRVVPKSDKVVTLRVRDVRASMYGIMIHPRIQATLALDAEYPDGTKTSVDALNTSPMGAPRAIDGAVLFALEELVHHDQFVAYVNSTNPPLAKRPAAAATATASTPVSPLTVATGAAAVAVAPSTRFPQPGDNWTYRLTERRTDRNPPPRKYAVKVVYSSEAQILDQLAVDGAPPSEWTHARGRYLISQGVSIFSPYLTVFENLSPGASLGDVVTTDDAGCRGRERCEVTGRVVGSEIVRVPAGSFNATKVTFKQYWRNPSGFQAAFDTTREVTVWYAPTVKRLVKISSRSLTGDRSMSNDFDLELVSHQVQ